MFILFKSYSIFMSIITLLICKGHADDKRKPQQIKRERKQHVYTGRAVDPQASKFEVNSLKKIPQNTVTRY